MPGRIAWVGPATRIEPARGRASRSSRREPPAVLALFELIGALAYED